MNEAYRAKSLRAAELNQDYTSEQLDDLLTAAGWQLTGRHRKQDKVQALLHLEGHKVQPEILAPLKLVQREGVL